MLFIFCVQVDPDILMRKMREQGLRLNHTNVWDNGRRKGKQYDLGRRHANLGLDVDLISNPGYLYFSLL